MIEHSQATSTMEFLHSSSVYEKYKRLINTADMAIGRKRKNNSETLIAYKEARRLHADGMKVTHACKMAGIHPNTFYRKRAEEEGT